MRSFHECRLFALFTSVRRDLQPYFKLVGLCGTLYNCFTSQDTFPLFLLKQINAVGFRSPFTAALAVFP